MTIQSGFPVFVVEDNPDDRMAILRELGKIQPRISLEFCETGSHALEILSAKKEKGSFFLPKIIILDLKLPGMSGIEFLECIRSLDDLRSIPVIVLTGSSDRRDLVSAFNGNVSSYILKPARIEELRDVLQKIASFIEICEFI